MLSLSAKRIPLSEEPFAGNEICRLYDEHAKSYMMPVYRHLARKIAQKKSTGFRILDIGTGSGLLAIELARVLNRDFQITGIDISEDMLDLAQKNIDQAGLSRKIMLKVSSSSAIPFPDKSFDIVISNASLHHWANPQAIFSEIKRVTATGGFCLIRDNMRLSPLFNPLVNIICFLKGMNESQYDLWVRAIRASYTVSEVNTLLINSELKNSKVSLNPTFLDLNIECSL